MNNYAIINSLTYVAAGIRLSNQLDSSDASAIRSDIVADAVPLVDIYKCAKALYQICIDENPRNRHSLPRLTSVFHQVNENKASPTKQVFCLHTPLIFGQLQLAAGSLRFELARIG